MPPWISYSSRSNKIKLIPWDSVFNLTSLSQHQSVMTMETFMKSEAGRVWPEGERTSLCYSGRPGAEENSCNAKHGSPFGPFWDSFQVSFDRSLMFSPLNFNTDPDNLRRWSERFPVSEYPVMAMTGAPASFPVRRTDVHRQKYLAWTDQWRARGRAWVTTNMGGGVGGRYIGLHLRWVLHLFLSPSLYTVILFSVRNGLDWSKACEHTETVGLGNLFSSAQCLGYSNERGQLTRELCLPSEDTVIRQLKQTLTKTNIKHVFVASDNDHMIEKFDHVFSSEGVKFYKQSGTSDEGFLLDLVILSQSKHFLGNCVSSYSAFVKRARDVDSLQSEFWTFSLENIKTEL